jgi:hypothetical protein
MYQSATQQQGGAQPPPGEPAEGGAPHQEGDGRKVEDASYEVVDDKDKK